MDARWHVEFTSVELTRSAEVTAPMEKDAASPVEKAAACERRGGKGGRRATALWHGGDAG